MEAIGAISEFRNVAELGAVAVLGFAFLLLLSFLFWIVGRVANNIVHSLNVNTLAVSKMLQAQSEANMLARSVPPGSEADGATIIELNRSIESKMAAIEKRMEAKR